MKINTAKKPRFLIKSMAIVFSCALSLSYGQLGYAQVCSRENNALDNSTLAPRLGINLAEVNSIFEPLANFAYFPKPTQGLIKAMFKFEREVGFKDKVVLDIDNIGVLSVLAKRLGAKKVYTISEPALRAKFANGMKDIESINVKEYELKNLPENLKVDILLVNLLSADFEVENNLKLLIRKYPDVKYIIGAGINISDVEPVFEKLALEQKTTQLVNKLDKSKNGELKKAAEFLKIFGEIKYLNLEGGATADIEISWEAYPIYIIEKRFDKYVPQTTNGERLKIADDWLFKRQPALSGNFADLGMGMMLDYKGMPVPQTTLELAKKYPDFKIYGIDEIIPDAAIRIGDYWGMFNKDGSLFNKDGSLRTFRIGKAVLDGYLLEKAVPDNKTIEEFKKLYANKIRGKRIKTPQVISVSKEKEVIYKPFELAKHKWKIKRENLVFIECEFKDLEKILSSEGLKFDYGRIFNVNQHYTKEKAKENLLHIAKVFREGGVVLEGIAVCEHFFNKLIFAEYIIGKNNCLNLAGMWFSPDCEFIFLHDKFAAVELMPTILRLNEEIGAKFLKDVKEMSYLKRMRKRQDFSPVPNEHAEKLSLIHELKKRNYQIMPGFENSPVLIGVSFGSKEYAIYKPIIDEWKGVIPYVQKDSLELVEQAI